MHEAKLHTIFVAVNAETREEVVLSAYPSRRDILNAYPPEWKTTEIWRRLCEVVDSEWEDTIFLD